MSNQDMLSFTLNELLNHLPSESSQKRLEQSLIELSSSIAYLEESVNSKRELFSSSVRAKIQKLQFRITNVLTRSLSDRQPTQFQDESPEEESAATSFVALT